MKTPELHRIQNSPIIQRPLGKRAPRIDPRTLKLAKYIPAAPPPPAEVSWIMEVAHWGMMLNDSIGDCTCAAAGHMIEQWTRYAAGTEAVVPDPAIEKAYEDVGGYISGQPQTDNGAVMLDVLTYWKQTGIGGHKIAAYATIDLNNTNELKTAVRLFGNVYLGIQLPISAQPQNAWTVPSGGPNGDGSPGSWGGHCVPIMAYSPQSLSVVTWGARLKMSWNFLKDYADEAYVVLSQEWIEVNGGAPSGFNLAQLQADLAAL